MVFGQLENLLSGEGFEKVASNVPEITFFFRAENSCVNVLYIIDYKQGFNVTSEQYRNVKEQIYAFFRQKNVDGVHILSLLICADTERARQVCGEDRFCWLLDPVENRLVIYENQVSDFYGVKEILEQFLFEISKEERERARTKHGPEKTGFKGFYKTAPWVNIALVIINVILYIICAFTGELLYNKGMFSVMDLIENGEWYRLLSSMFLHVDIVHLVNNMLILYYIGNVVERHVGHPAYIVIYFLSGLAGNIFSAGYELFTGSYRSSLGASGAVFGIEGALLMLVILNKGKMAGITTGRLVFALAFSLYCGFTSVNVANMAHIGGLLMGFAAAGVYWLAAGRR